MACGSCNKKKFGNPEEKKKIVDRLRRGMCKINVVRRKERPGHHFCTLERTLIPKRGSDFYKNVIKENMEDENHVIAWSLNKNKEKNLEPEAGWIKIPTSEIIGWKFVGGRYERI